VCTPNPLSTALCRCPPRKRLCRRAETFRQPQLSRTASHRESWRKLAFPFRIEPLLVSGWLRNSPNSSRYLFPLLLRPSENLRVQFSRREAHCSVRALSLGGGPPPCIRSAPQSCPLSLPSVTEHHLLPACEVVPTRGFTFFSHLQRLFFQVVFYTSFCRTAT